MPDTALYIVEKSSYTEENTDTNQGRAYAGFFGTAW